MNRDKKVRNSELFEEVSFNADDRHQVQSVLKESKVRRNVFSKGKRALVPVIIILILCAGIYLPSNPVLALSKLPFFESIFQFLGDSGLRDATKENKQNVQHQKSEDGMSMEIQEAIYDGKRLSISYVIKSEKPIKNYTSRMVNFYIPFDGFQKGGFMSNDQFKQVSDHEVIGYSTFTYTGSEMPDDIMVDFLYRGTTDYTSDKQKEFKFLFEVPVKKTTKIDTVVFNKKKSFEEEELKLKQISLSPISTVISLQYKAPYQNNPDYESLSIRLLDQDNRVIKEVPNGIGWFRKPIKEKNRWYTLEEANILFEPLDKEIEEIKIQLFKNKKNTYDLYDTQVKFIALSEAKNQLLNLGERGTMKITDIKQEEDSAVIRYEYKSNFAFYQNFLPLALKSADGNWHHGIEVERKYLGNETYMVEELFLDLPKEKLEVRYLQQKAPELIEELEIKVTSDEIKNGIKVQ